MKGDVAITQVKIGVKSILGVVALLSAVLAAIAGSASAAVTAPSAGEVVRDEGTVEIVEDTGGRYLSNNAALLCNGSSANRTPPASGRIQVIRESDNTTVVDETHVTPNALTATSANASAPYSVSWDTTGAEPGTYRILSTAVDVNRASLFAQCVGSNATLSDFTVEFRPWQKTFNDLLGTGKVWLNPDAREAQWKVKQNKSPVISGNVIQLFGGPGELLAAADPEACVDDPASCLPASAVECGPGCDANFALINAHDPEERDDLTGVFDLQTGAFVALARAKGTTRVLLSLGDDTDAAINQVLGQITDGLSAGTGIDLANLLSTTVRVKVGQVDGNQTEFLLSLAELLTIQYLADNGPNGINKIAPFSLGAGQINHTYTYAVALADCGPTPHAGYEVTESQLVPSTPPVVVPLPPPLLVLEPGGVFKRIDGDYLPGSGSHLVGNTLTGPEIDTAPDSPTGLPLWVPLINEGSVADSDIDFVGHAIVVIVPEIRIDPIPVLLPDGACIGFGLIIGSGAAVFGDNRIPFDQLPLLWDEQSPALLGLIETINGATGDALSDPAVQDALGTVLGLLGGGTPELPEIPEVPSP